MGAQADAMDDISTRTPHAGSDLPEQIRSEADLRFQPALPMRGVTQLSWL